MTASLWMPRNLRGAMVMLTLVIAAISPVFTAFGTPGLPGRASAAAALLGAALAALQLRHSFAAAAGNRPAGGLWTLGAMIVLVYAPVYWFTWNWLAAQALVVASVPMVLGERRRAFLLAALPAAGTVLFLGIVYVVIGRPGWSVGGGIFEMFWWGAGLAVIPAALYGAARLVRTASELRAAHTELAELAIAAERLRICRDLHDLIGQSLSAVSLRGDLALRLLPADPDAAQAEIVTLVGTARNALHDILAVTRNDAGVDLRAEAEGAKALLAAAGVDTRISLEPDALPADATAVFGWALREGVTNVLRHSDAASCSIIGSRIDGRAWLEIVNDGARPKAASHGNGLTGLAERARAFDGAVTAGPTADGTFRLLVELPVEEP